MSYKSELQSNNADLLEILNQINAMPEGGGGAGGGEGSGGGGDVSWLHIIPVDFPDFSTEATAYK